MPSSSLWSVGVGALAISSLVAPALATGDAKQSYQLQEDWHGKKFFDYFEFFDQPDPTNGFVTYVNQSYAQSSGLVDITESGSLYMGVDYQTKLSPNGPGRESVRIESKEFYHEGLYIIDIKHMPGGVCGTWPAFWSVGPSWPEDGEIDIIEGVNKHDSNKIVLHTSGSCDVSGEHDMTGSMTSGECGEASGTIGCVVEGQKGSSGDPFNAQGGGVYAMEWTPKFIKIWFFPRSSIPASLEKGHPDTAQFGTPMAHLQGTCNFHERFTAQKFILNTAFCGDWAGGVFGDSGCPVSDPSNPIQSCVNYVAENPAAFKDAYWEINSIKLFELGTPKPEKPETTSVVQGASTSTANGAVVTSIQSANSVSTAQGGKSTSMTQVIENTSITETQRTEAPAAPSNTADVEPTKAPQHTEGPKHTAAPGGSAGSGSDDDQDQDDGDDEEPQRSTVWITSTSTYCPKNQGGSIATAPPVPAKPSTEVAVAVPSAPGPSHAEDKTVPVVVPTVPAATEPATEPAPKPTGVSPEGQTPEGKTPGSKHPVDETPEGSSSQSSIEVKPPPTASTGIPVGNTRPAVPSGTPSSSGFVPVPTHAGGVPHGTTGSAPSATTPSSPVFTGAASSLSIGLTGVMGALAMALFA